MPIEIFLKKKTQGVCKLTSVCVLKGTSVIQYPGKPSDWSAAKGKSTFPLFFYTRKTIKHAGLDVNWNIFCCSVNSRLDVVLCSMFIFKSFPFRYMSNWVQPIKGNSRGLQRGPFARKECFTNCRLIDSLIASVTSSR